MIAPDAIRGRIDRVTDVAEPGETPGMMTLTRLTWVGVLALGGCVTPKTVGQTPETESDAGSQGSSEGTQESGDPGPGGQCSDNPGTCADVDGNFCGDSAGGPISEFDADCCVRPRCDFDGECDGDRVCVALGLWGSGASSSLWCTIEDDACVCGATADGAPDPRVCVRPEDAPVEPPPQCRLEATGDAYTLDPIDASGSADCVVTGVAGTTFDLDCTGEITGALTIAVASGAASVRLVADEQVAVLVDSRATAEFVEQWLRITDADGEHVVVAARAQTLVAPDATPTWPTNVEGVALADLGCPAVECEAGGSQWAGRLIRAGEGEPLAVGPGESSDIPGEFGGSAPVLSVFEAHVGNCDPIDGPTEWYAYTIVVP